MRTIVLANGAINNYAATKQALAGAEYIIACDGGLNHAHLMGITPHVVIGDMDSADPKLLEGIHALVYPAEKDETDMELSIAHAREKGASSIRIIGAMGGRFDHALANVHLLDENIEIWDENTSIQLISHAMSFPRGNYDTLSLIPLTTEVTGIVTDGLFYPLNGETLKIGSSRGISNVFCKDTATVSIESGLLLAIRIAHGGKMR